MPRAPATPCRQQGCPRLVQPPGFCDVHRRVRETWAYEAQNRARSARADPDDAFYHTKRWQRLRASVLSQEPLCRACRERGLVTPAVLVDHIDPVKQGGDKWDRDNLQPLCLSCHEAKSALEGSRRPGRRGSAYPDWLEPAACRVMLVVGPPAAGKSTYVREHARRGDQVIDLADIMAALSAQPLYHAGKEWLDRGLRERNRLLGELKRAAPERVVWYVTTAAGERLPWWQDRLGPTRTIEIDTPLQTCIERIEQDPARPDHVKPLHIAAARDWWAQKKGEIVLA